MRVASQSSSSSHGKKCFVIMPFRPEFDRMYAGVISPVVTSAGLYPVRADTVYSTRTIMSDILEQITNATAIIADVTGRNPNVNYELGIAHALGKPTIIITQCLKDLPFDYRDYRAHEYSLTPSGLRCLDTALSKSLKVIVADRSGFESLGGRWVGWYKEPDDHNWNPTAHEIKTTGGRISVIAYGVSNQSQSICAHADRDAIGKWRLIWTYDSKIIRGGYDLADHTGTHIALFVPGRGSKKLMEGMYFNDRKQRSGHIGAVGEFRCEWVSHAPRHSLAFTKDRWPKNRASLHKANP